MKVVVLAGAARSLVNFRGPLIRAMVSAGHAVIACSPEQPSDVRDELLKIGATPREIPLQRTGMSILADLRALSYLRDLFRELRPDLILSYMIKPVIYGSLAGRTANVPRIASMITGLGYTFGTESVKQRLLGILTRLLYKQAMRANSVVFFQNPDDLRLFVNSGWLDNPAKAVLINGSGVDLEHFFKAPPAVEGPSFLLIARLIREKGIIEFVEAAKILKSKYPQACFRILGPFDGNPSAISPASMNRWQSEGIIDYLGETNDVRPYLAETSVYVLPSYYREGTPRSVLEAMAMGRPVITTDAPGCRETVVHGKSGYLVPVKDPVRLAEAMERFILKPELIEFMGEASYKLACEKYDVHYVNKAIMSALNL